MSGESTPALARHVDKLWPEREDLPTLLEAAEEVERTIGTPGYQAIELVLAAEIAQIDRKLDGRPLEQAEYARLHGKRSALRAFEEAASSIITGATKRRRAAEAAESNGVAAESVAGR